MLLRNSRGFRHWLRYGLWKDIRRRLLHLSIGTCPANASWSRYWLRDHLNHVLLVTHALEVLLIWDYAGLELFDQWLRECEAVLDTLVRVVNDCGLLWDEWQRSVSVDSKAALDLG